jgi:hypothetical protein
MTDPAKAARRARHEAIRAEVADEETKPPKPKLPKTLPPSTYRCTSASAIPSTPNCGDGRRPNTSPPPRSSDDYSFKLYTNAKPYTFSRCALSH